MVRIRIRIILILLSLILSGCTPTVERPHITIPGYSTAPITEARKSVIIYPQNFSEAARAFGYLHREFGSTEPILVSLEEISTMVLPTDSIHVPFRGWQNERPSTITIRNYDFELSKKIIAYLRYLEKQEKILAVLLLGDGALIPPSYYFYVPFLKGVRADNKRYNEWIASDLLYGSPDFDLVNEWAVGRISVDTPEQALLVAEKYYQWELDNRKNAPLPFIYFAGNIRKDLVYSGELLYLLLEQMGIPGPKTHHYFESDQRYTISQLKKSFTHDPARIHYIFTHGSGDGFEIDGDYLHSDDIAELPHKRGLPLIISPSCMDGGFDYDLIDVPHDLDGYSIGEAILRAPGAGIGYLGSSRISLGQFHYTMKDGEIDAEGIYYRYMPGLLIDFLDAYHGGIHRIGDAYVEAHARYRNRFGITDPKDFATFVEINLLADPVMILPATPGANRGLFVEHLELLSPHTIKHRMPLVPLKEPVEYALHVNSLHNTAAVTIVNARTGENLLQDRINRKKHLLFTPKQKSSYLIRLDFPDGTISWQFFQSGYK